MRQKRQASRCCSPQIGVYATSRTCVQGASAVVFSDGQHRCSCVREHAERIAAAITAATSGYAEVDVPFEQRPDRV
jgi:hypothetical protein